MNTQTKHTPGPWAFEELDGGFGNKEQNFFISCASDNLKEGIVMACRSAGDDLSAAESEANARLIAAAPDLLEALHKAKESLLGMKEMINSMGAGYGLGATWEVIERAIAKAEGGQL